MGREQGRAPEEVDRVTDQVSQNSADQPLQAGLVAPAPLPRHLERGGAVFRLLAGHCQSLDSIGRGMAWVLLTFPRLETERSVAAAVKQAVIGKLVMSSAVHRAGFSRSRPLFPLPLGSVSKVAEVVTLADFSDFTRPHFAGLSMSEVWTAVGVLGLNGMAGFGRAASELRITESQRTAVQQVAKSTTRALPRDVQLLRTPEEAEKELATRFVSYTGEEVPKMQILRVIAAKAALPPETHGGSIDALSLVSAGTRWFLEHPEKSLLEVPKEGSKLQSKVHIAPGEESEFCKLLVERRICAWVADDEVLMFAVGKGTILDNGMELQRTIMNLVPSNACFRQLEGATKDLPSICQYLSLVLGDQEQLSFYQSDMSSAFYLFKIPAAWSRMLAFNIRFCGETLGLQRGVWYRPACAVIPMGWHSAVAVMQELADRLTVISRLPPAHKVRRTSPLPQWLTDTLDASHNLQRPWYHVYLDNFCAMEKVAQAQADTTSGQRYHDQLEAGWKQTGVLSSAKKRVSGASAVQELGAHFDGQQGVMGASPERLLRLIQSTLVVIGKERRRKKWVQVLAGRWMHCMAFRRPVMVLLDVTWGFIAGQASGFAVEAKTRGELFGCCTLAMLMHTNLRAQVTEVTTASDASSTGGAVGKATALTRSGTEFVATDLSGHGVPRRIPVLLLSLFNGIGCAFRCYDLCGVFPMVAISYELDAAGNRITSRRWPHVQIEKDVRSITEDTIRAWMYAHPEVEEIHVWAGFPCVDLSKVKAGRMNLEGAESGLFFEIPRIIKDIRKVFGYRFPVKYCVENVASMDESAASQISEVLGVKPLRLDPWGVVPIHRPRFCWSNTDLTPMDGVVIEEKRRWIEVEITHEYPDLEQWIEPGVIWPGFARGAVLPTCMKAIKRAKLPPSPAGLDRVDQNGYLRWMADSFRFPPINTMRNLYSGLVTSGVWFLHRNGNCFMDWGLIILRYVGMPLTLRLHHKDTRTPGRLWLGIASVVFPLLLWPPCFVKSGFRSLPMMLFLKELEWPRGFRVTST